MKLRVFTRTSAERVQPGDEIESPRRLTVDEVTNSRDGIRLRGKSPTSSRTSSLDVKRGDPIELPVKDPDAVSALMVRAFTALRSTTEDDDDGDDFDFSWNHQSSEFVVTQGGSSMIIAVDSKTPATPEGAPTPKPTPAPAAAKAPKK